MGAMAEALVAYAQPLLDETDGSEEQMQRAFTLSTLCYNLALIPEEIRERAIDEMKISLKMGDEEFEAFRRTVIAPMIQRHRTMFAQRRESTDVGSNGPWRRTRPTAEATAEENAKTDRYAPCPCNSGLKYKFCCGKK
jgi:preprotein translocase subunit SecA